MDYPAKVRCPKKTHGILLEPGVWEVRCDSVFCGARQGIVVLHRFDTATGNLIETKRFRSLDRNVTPKQGKEG